MTLIGQIQNRYKLKSQWSDFRTALILILRELQVTK